MASAILLAVIPFTAAAQVAQITEDEIAGVRAKLPPLLASSEADSFIDSLKDAGSNWPEFVGALDALQDETQKRALIWLANRMPHIDRLEVTKDFLTENVLESFRAWDEIDSIDPNIVPSLDIFYKYILTYRISDEPIEAYRKVLRERFAAQCAGKAPALVAKIANEWVAKNVKLRDPSYFGGMASPLLVLRGRRATASEMTAFCLGLLRTFGIPARRAFCPGLQAEGTAAVWVEFFDGSKWLPMYPRNPESFGDFGRWERKDKKNVSIVKATSAFEFEDVTAAYTRTGTLKLKLVQDGEPIKAFERFSITVFGEGEWIPISDYMDTKTDDQGEFSVVLGDGKYLVAAGVREQDGSVFIVSKEVEILPGERTAVALDLTKD
jgi:hypothetical protein